jgi:alpha/beta superfamily hydrolase
MELTIQGPAGRLEAIYDPPEEGVAPRAAAAVCHPHPLYRGTMDNTVVFRTARALRRAGLAVVRFNFRGVEGSEGEHHGEGDEERDLAAVLGWLEERHPGADLWAAGYSFGARTACGLASWSERVRRVVCVALPVLHFDCACVEELPQPALFVFAGEDEFGTLAAMRERFPVLPPHFELVEIPGTDHFFRRKTPALEEAVHTWARDATEKSA